MARAFYREMVGMLDDLFPHNIGVVLEVEPFDHDRLEAIISDLERTGSRQLDENDRAEIRKFLRVSWYHKPNYTFFIDSSTWRPIACRWPCIDPSLPRLGWADEEADYWLMWRTRAGQSSATPDAAGLWRRAVDAIIYLEILAKSLVAAGPGGRRYYWDYATALVAQTLKRTTMVNVCELSRFRRQSAAGALAALEDRPVGRRKNTAALIDVSGCRRAGDPV